MGWWPRRTLLWDITGTEPTDRAIASPRWRVLSLEPMEAQWGRCVAALLSQPTLNTVPTIAATAIVQESWTRGRAISAARAFSRRARAPNEPQRARRPREVSLPTRADAFESEAPAAAAATRSTSAATFAALEDAERYRTLSSVQRRAARRPASILRDVDRVRARSPRPRPTVFGRFCCSWAQTFHNHAGPPRAPRAHIGDRICARGRRSRALKLYNACVRAQKRF